MTCSCPRVVVQNALAWFRQCHMYGTSTSFFRWLHQCSSLPRLSTSYSESSPSPSPSASPFAICSTCDVCTGVCTTSIDDRSMESALVAAMMSTSLPVRGAMDFPHQRFSTLLLVKLPQIHRWPVTLRRSLASYVVPVVDPVSVCFSNALHHAIDGRSHQVFFHLTSPLALSLMQRIASKELMLVSR